MKNYLYVLLLALLAAGCSPQGGYTLTGEVPEAWEGKPVVLYTADTGDALPVDSTRISDGRFRLRGTFDRPRYCRVAVFLDPENRGNRDLTVTFPLFLDSTAVHAVYDDSEQQPAFTLSGGATQTAWQEYADAVRPLQNDRSRTFDAYVEKFYHQEDIRGGAAKALEVSEKAARLREFKTAYVRRNPASVVSLRIVEEMCDRNTEMTRAQTDSLFGLLAQPLRESPAGKHLGRMIADKRIFPGQPLPDLEVRDTQGRTRRVSDLLRPGHYTLVEIWASWCMPCRGEIPFLKKAYEQYRRKGFDILSISIDSREENWKTALEDERMPWTQVLDMPRRSFSVYETTAVPTSMLVGPDGTIVRLNARGGWLEASLENIYAN